MLLSLSILSLLPLFAIGTIPSIGNVPAYSSQRPCAQYCFGDNVNGAAWRLAEVIGCSYDTPSEITNECICSNYLQPSADAWLSKCVNTQCSQDSMDVTTAVSIYDAYCTGAGFGSSSSGAQATTTQPGATSASSTAPATTSVQVSQTSTSSAAQTSSATGKSGGNGGGLSTSDKISLGVGIGVGLPGAIVSIGLIVKWCCYSGRS